MSSVKDQLVAHLAAKNVTALSSKQLAALDDFMPADPPSVIEEVGTLRDQNLGLKREVDALRADKRELQGQISTLVSERDAALAERDAAQGEVQ